MSTDALTNEKPARHVSPWLKFGVPVLVVAVIVGAVVGGVVGSHAAKSNKNSNVANAGDSSSSSSASSTSSTKTSSSSSTKGGSSTTSSSAAAATTSSAANFLVAPLPAWDWSKDKAIGMCTGNWLILERWMDEDWFTSVAGGNVWDEWGFASTPNATAELKAHFDTWITEDDFEIMYQNGINSVRIPTGYWSWIPTASGEPYVDAGAKGYLELAMQWAYKRQMRILLDMHGLPGSQNGEESSGHNTTSPSWFGNTVNQNRSSVLIQTVMNWLETNPYRTTVIGLEVINEPRPYTAAQDVELSNYYASSYDIIQASSYPVPMFLHPGFYATNPLQYWQPFVTARATSPPSVVYEDHPYPGNFPPQTGEASILTQICSAADKYLGYPVPIAITEWSLYTGVKDVGFETTFFQDQLVAWAWSAGGFYWSYKLIPSKLQLSISLDYSQYSFITVVQNVTGTIPTPAGAGLTNTTTTANALAYIDSFTGNCGAAPANVAPYNNGTFTTNPWTAEISAQSALATTKVYATGAPARHRRLFRG